MQPQTAQERQTLEHWRWRLVALLLGAILGVSLVGVFYQTRRDGDEISLGPQQFTIAATWRGEQIAGKSLTDYEAGWPTDTPPGPSALWLGNSQVHTINQFEQGMQTAPHHASEALGWAVRCLSLPNASLQEHLVVTAWALDQRTPDHLVLALVYDDLREDGLRPRMDLLATEGALATLRTSGIGSGLASELEAMLGGARDDGLATSADSFQDRSEAALENALSAAWPLWRARGDVLASVKYDMVQFRNLVFGIDPTTKRRMIPVLFDKNMEALDAILSLAAREGVRTLVYIAPLRQDIEPPYDLEAYGLWKDEIRSIAEAAGASYADLDSIVPGPEWGTIGEEQLDFMHFRVGGHVVLGEAVARLLRDAGGGG
jgi:hypothetical protein